MNESELTALLNEEDRPIWINDDGTIRFTEAKVPTQPAEVTVSSEALAYLAAQIPDDLKDTIRRLTEDGVEWGSTEAKSDAEHVAEFANSLRLTRESHSMDDGPRALHGVYTKGTETVVCHTGTSPNSAANARLITGLIESIGRTGSETGSIRSASVQRRPMSN